MRDFKVQMSQLILSTPRPIVVFDLDGTLFDVTWRTVEILNRFVQLPEIREHYQTELGLLKNLDTKNFKYTVEQNLNEVGISRHSERGAEFIIKAENFWFRHFFTDELVAADRPYAGAAQVVHWFEQAGVHIVYLSGRDIPNMSRGTLNALETHGFPHKGRTVSMLLKPDYGMDDLLFKRQSMEALKSEGHVVATFDNEPANVDMFLKEFPKAQSVHFKSAHAKHLDLTGDHFWAISSWAELGF